MTASIGNSFITINPDELRFQFELEKQTFCDLKVLNKTEYHVAFKVKTTSPKKYFVRPNTGVIHPWDSCIIRVTLQAQQEYPPDMQCKDKFLIQSTTVSPNIDVDDLPPDTFTKDSEKLVEELKLRVVYISATSPQGSTGDDAVKNSAQKLDAYSSPTLLQLKEERDATLRQMSQLQQELDMLKRRRDRRSYPGFSFTFAMFVGLIGFLFVPVISRSSQQITSKHSLLLRHRLLLLCSGLPAAVCCFFDLLLLAAATSVCFSSSPPPLLGACLKMVEGIASNSPMENTDVPATPQLNSMGVTQEVEAPPNEVNMENQDQQEERSPNKRGLTSEAWKHFKRQKIDDKWKAICKYCDKKLGGDTKQGTKHLHDHIRTCKLRTVRGPRQSVIKVMEQAAGSSGNRPESLVVGNYTFNQEVGRRELARMIVLHEYPLMMVDHIGFRRYSHALQPLFKIVTRNTVKSDIMKLYQSERSKQMKLLAKNSSRIAITTDMWTSSNQNKGYMSVTAHYIDDNWTLQNQIVRFIYVPTPHTAEVICDVLVECLLDWNIDRKLSTLTVDNCNTNDAVVGLLFAKMPSSSFVLSGELFHMRCCAHILNLIVKDGLSTISKSIENIRDSVGFWVATPKREEKFRDTCHQLNMTYGKKLAPDCRTRWNSTYLMLASALPYQDVFKRLGLRDPLYKCLPSEADWKMATEICDKLKIFFQVTELFSGTKYPTSNIYFPKVCEIRLALRSWQTSCSDTIKKMASDMIEKFDKYWGVINGVMAVGAVLDPRYKMTLLNYFFPLMYGDKAPDELERVKTLCQDLVDEYQAKDKSVIPASTDSSSSTLTNVSYAQTWECGYVQYVKENVSTLTVKSEFNYYLEEPVLLKESNVQNFDILGWWKQNGLKYPTLQKIARDFLAIPISTVASESAFSTSGRVLSSHRSRLNEDTLEALMCTQDWMRSEMQCGSSSSILHLLESVGEDMDEDSEVAESGT